MKRIAVVLFFAVMAQVYSGVKLRYNYEKNKPLYYQIKMEQVSSFTSPDSGQKTLNISTEIVMKQELIEKDTEGNMKVAMTVLEAQQTVNGIKKPFSQATNQTQIVTMKDTGTLISVLTPFAGQSPEQNAMQMVFPEKELTAGDTWTSIKEVAEPIPVETKTLYKITEMNPQVVTISSMMRLKNTGGDEVNASMEGKTIFDHTNGKISRSEADSQFQFEIPLKVPGLLPNNSNVKVTLRIKVEINEIQR
jgi:hypothetical protein